VPDDDGKCYCCDSPNAQNLLKFKFAPVPYRGGQYDHDAMFTHVAAYFCNKCKNYCDMDESALGHDADEALWYVSQKIKSAIEQVKKFACLGV
jgi:hypothetical protein